MRKLRASLSAILVAGALALAAPPARAQSSGLFREPRFGVRKIPNLVYGSGPVEFPSPVDRDLLLDLYLPEGAGLPPLLPGCLVVHGGGYVMGAKDSGGLDLELDGVIDHNTVEQYAIELTRRGYVTVSIDYRLLLETPTVRPENEAFRSAAALEDARKAFAWMQANAATYRLDPTRIALGGYSAGGEVVMLAAYMNADSASYLNPGPVGAGAVFSLSGAMFTLYPPWIETGEPPLFWIHGDADTFVSPWIPDVIAARARSVGVEVEYWKVPFEDHFYLLDRDIDGQPLIQRIADFLFDAMDLTLILEASVPEGAWGIYRGAARIPPARIQP